MNQNSHLPLYYVTMIPDGTWISKECLFNRTLTMDTFNNVQIFHSDFAVIGWSHNCDEHFHHLKVLSFTRNKEDHVIVVIWIIRRNLQKKKQRSIFPSAYHFFFTIRSFQQYNHIEYSVLFTGFLSSLILCLLNFQPFNKILIQSVFNKN